MTDGAASRTLPHLAHWGAFRVTVEDDRVIAVAGHPDDPAPLRLEQELKLPLHAGGWASVTTEPASFWA